MKTHRDFLLSTTGVVASCVLWRPSIQCITIFLNQASIYKKALKKKQFLKDSPKHLQEPTRPTRVTSRKAQKSSLSPGATATLDFASLPSKKPLRFAQILEGESSGARGRRSDSRRRTKGFCGRRTAGL